MVRFYCGQPLFPASVGYAVYGDAKPHKPASLVKLELLFNRCKACDVVVKGRVARAPNRNWYWTCPHCYRARLYPR